MEERRGQMQISFNFIIAIILIVAAIGVAFYVITVFLSLGECSEMGLFYRDLESAVDKAWQAEITERVFTGVVPGEVEQVCFGDLNELPRTGFSEQYQFLKRYGSHGVNVFLYPGGGACDGELARHLVDHVAATGLFCVDVVDGRVSLELEKGSFDSEVSWDTSDILSQSPEDSEVKWKSVGG
jgi:hypothetical protein